MPFALRFAGRTEHAVFQLKKERIQRFRPAIQESLAQFDPHIPEKIPLFLGFDSFRQGVDPLPDGDLCHGPDDFPVQPVAGIQIPDQGHVKLDQIHVKNILALRGDRIPGKEPVGDFNHANELVKFVHEQRPDFSIASACYPNCHTEAADFVDDISHLKEKVAAGAFQGKN